MDQIERRGWWIVAVIFFFFFTILLVNAGYQTQSLFFTPILKTFGWSRAELSLLPAMINIAIAFGSLPVGWLLDRIAPRLVIIGGIALVVASFLLSSHAHAYSTLFVADVMMGLGLAASSMVPGAFLVANWLRSNRALAMTVIANGTALGGMTSNLVVNALITAFGWRSAFLLLTLPLLLVMIPLVLLVVRNRPRPKPSAVAPTALAGLEVREAFASRSFWLLVLCPALYGFGANGILLHLVPNLLSLGYRPRTAALVIAGLLGCAGLVKLVLGLLADRFSARLVLSFDLVVFGCAIICWVLARHPLMVALGVVFAGAPSGAPSALFPVVVAEAMGLKRYGTLSGISSWATWIGGVGGMVGGGWIFDHTGSYQVAFTVYMAVQIVSGICVLAVRPYQPRPERSAGELAFAGNS